MACYPDEEARGARWDLGSMHDASVGMKPQEVAVNIIEERDHKKATQL